MDTTETYIKMCDNDDVQSLLELLALEDKQGSTFIKADDHNVIVWAANMITAPPAIKFIRLPHQDQLQKLVEYPSVFDALSKFVRTIFSELETTGEGNHQLEMQGIYSQYINFTSREQLELAFVMKEKYGKVWNGEKWLS